MQSAIRNFHLSPEFEIFNELVVYFLPFKRRITSKGLNRAQIDDPFESTLVDCDRTNAQQFLKGNGITFGNTIDEQIRFEDDFDGQRHIRRKGGDFQGLSAAVRY